MNPALFDWDGLCKSLGLRNVKNDDGSDWLNCSCPMHKDERPSFGINKQTGVYSCFVCGTGTIVGLLSNLYSISDSDAKEKLETFSSSPMAFDAWLRSFSDISKRRNFRNEQHLLSEAMLGMYNPGPNDYNTLIQRGFDPQVLASAEVGYDRVLRRNTFPIRSKTGRFTGLIGRSIRTSRNGTTRWKVYWETRIREQLYNVQNVLENQELLITEGPLDVLRAIQFDYPSNSIVGIFSATPTRTQLDLIRSLSPKSIILGLDADEAGAIGTLKLLETFIDEVPMFQLEFPKNTKDIGEQSYKSFWKMYEKRHSPILKRIGELSSYKIGFS
jgi:DNA primase